MKYGLLDENNILLEKRVKHQQGFVEIPDSAQIGQILQSNGGYLTPAVTISPDKVLSDALADITWIRPSDSVEIQIRHPKYAADGLVMQGVIDEMSNLTDTEDWIAKDNSWVVVTKQDLLDALAFRVSEIKRLYAEYKVATENA
jgi:hypothetical protein